jgi:death-on-curing protein
VSAIVFLSVADVIEIHERVITEFGGHAELRDRGLLESAIAMPHAMFSGQYLHPELPDMAAAYHYHLCANHPFVDGNKRVAVTAAEVFLLANGLELHCTDGELEEITLGTASSLLTKEHITEFYAAHTRKIE